MDKVKFGSNGQWSVAEQPTSIESFAKSYVDQYVNLTKSTETTLFKRYENKYIIPRALRKSFEKLLAEHLKPDYLDGKTKYNLMKSTYFDSANFDMVKNHMSKSIGRFKVRTREYAPDGKFHKSDFTFLEVKAKNGDVTDKFRIKVPKETMESFKKGTPIVPTVQLMKINTNIAVADLVKRIGDINQALELFHLRPSCETTYIRRAYTDGAANDAGLRVTFDEDIKYKVLDVVPTSVSAELRKDNEEHNKLKSMLSTYSPKDSVVVEVKHHGTVPDWLTKFFVDNHIPQTHFSKYCYSIAKHAIG